MSNQTSSGRNDAENAAKNMVAEGGATYSRRHSKLDTSISESIVSIIVKDHENLRQLYENYKQLCAGAGDIQQRENLAASIIREISIHSYLEENVLYPQYRQLLGEIDGKAAEKHSLDEHQKVKNLAYELDQDFDVKKASFSTQLGETMRVFNHHSNEEESDYLVKLQSKAPIEKLIELGKEFESKRKMAPTRPHPSAGSSTLAGMVAKPLDAVRDAASGRGEKSQRGANKE